MPQISMKALLESGVHFGHQTKRWNPKMKKFRQILKNYRKIKKILNQNVKLEKKEKKQVNKL